jgi:hypothetical protein
LRLAERNRREGQSHQYRPSGAHAKNLALTESVVNSQIGQLGRPHLRKLLILNSCKIAKRVKLAGLAICTTCWQEELQ